MGWLHDDITNEDFLFIGNFVAYRTRMDWYVAGFTDYVTTRQMGPSAKGLRLVRLRLSLLQCLCTQSGVSRFSGRIDRKISWAR